MKRGTNKNTFQCSIENVSLAFSFKIIQCTDTFKEKLKLSHYTPRRRLGERKYSSCSVSTSALDGGEWSASRPDRALAPGKGSPVPIVQEAVWAQEPAWTQSLEE
jgi:hypothetical protein